MEVSAKTILHHQLNIMVNDQQLNKKERLMNEQKRLIHLIKNSTQKNDEIIRIAKEAVKAENLTKINECFDKLIDFCFTNRDDDNRKEIMQKTFDVLKGKKAQLAYEMSPKSSFSSLDDTKEGAIGIIKENLKRVGLNNNDSDIWLKFLNYFLRQNDYEKVIEEYEETIRNCPDSASVEETKSEIISIIELIEAKQHQNGVEAFLKNIVQNKNFYGQGWKYPLTKEEKEKFSGKRKISEIKKLWKEFTEKQLKQEILGNIQSSEQFDTYLKSKVNSPEEKAVVLKVLKKEKEGILIQTRETTKKIRNRIIELEWEMIKEKKENQSVAEQVNSAISVIETNLNDLIIDSELKHQLVTEGHIVKTQTWQNYLKEVTTTNDLTIRQGQVLVAVTVVLKSKIQENEGKINQLQTELNTIKESENQLDNSFQIQNLDSLWQENIKDKLGIPQTENLPINWLDQLVTKNELDNVQNDLKKEADNHDIARKRLATLQQEKEKVLEVQNQFYDQRIDDGNRILELQQRNNLQNQSIQQLKNDIDLLQKLAEIELNDKQAQVPALVQENERYKSREKIVSYGSMIGGFLVIGGLIAWRLKK